jgi:cell division protease FtsH
VTEQLPIDERHLYTEGYLKDSLAIRMGGRVAEQLVFGETSTGASNDLAGATDLATRMVREFGMSQTLGPVGFATGSPLYLGGEEVRSRPYAEATQRVVDEEVAKLPARRRAPGHRPCSATTRRPGPADRAAPGTRDRRRHRRR